MLSPRFDRYVPRGRRDALFLRLAPLVEIVEVVQQVRACRDPDDDKFLETAVNGRADVVVSGDADLAALYAVVRMTATRELLMRFASVFTWSAALAALAALVGMVGFGVSWLGVTTRLATLAETPIPYLGSAPRAVGFTAHPGMLASILVLAVLLHAGRVGGRWLRRDVAVLMLLVAGLALTMSKTMICLVAGLAVMLGTALGRSASCRVRWVAPAAWVTAALMFTTAAHVVLVRESAVGGAHAIMCSGAVL